MDRRDAFGSLQSVYDATENVIVDASAVAWSMDARLEGAASECDAQQN